jgi:hypothetical protein
MAALLPNFETETRAVDEWLSNLHVRDAMVEQCA